MTTKQHGETPADQAARLPTTRGRLSLRSINTCTTVLPTYTSHARGYCCSLFGRGFLLTIIKFADMTSSRLNGLFEHSRHHSSATAVPNLNSPEWSLRKLRHRSEQKKVICFLCQSEPEEGFSSRFGTRRVAGGLCTPEAAIQTDCQSEQLG